MPNVPTHGAEAIKNEFATATWKLTLGPLDPEKAIAAAGVAAAARNPKHISEVDPNTKTFKQALANGRLGCL